MNEKIYRKMLDELPVAVLVIDKKLKVRYSNGALRGMFSSVKPRGQLGEIICCSNFYGRCGGSEDCKYCSLVAAFAQGFRMGEGVHRVVHEVVDGVEEKKISLSVAIKPLDSELLMGVFADPQEIELEDDINKAKLMQQKLLPIGHSVAGVHYNYVYLPCHEIGGDLPDVYESEGKAHAFIADVSGKGISAGMLSAFVKAGYDKTISSPAQAVTLLNEKFVQLNQDESSYITVAAIRVDESEVTYTMAGHVAPILLKRGDDVYAIDSHEPPVSVWFEGTQYSEEKIKYSHGDVLVLTTDGVTEARNENGEMFGVERTMQLLRLSRNADDFLSKIKIALKRFEREQSDDITVIAFDL